MIKVNTHYNIGENSSLGTGFNFLASYDKVYVIDNHLAAFWCWLKIPFDKPYKLIHVDQHYDCSSIYENTEALINSIDWRNLKLEELSNIYFDKELERPLLTWDNYICSFYQLRPSFFEMAYFFTHGVGDFDYLGKSENYDFEQIYNFKFTSGTNYLLNLDIDIFFSNDFKRVQFSEPDIKRMGKWINKNILKFEQIIICLSPELCGGWSNSKKMANLILNEIGYKM